MDRVPIGGTRWTNYAALQLARYLEVFLDGTPPACEIRLWQLTILDAPTDQPTLAVQYITECEASGDFDCFATDDLLDFYRNYYGLSVKPPTLSDAHQTDEHDPE